MAMSGSDAQRLDADTVGLHLSGPILTVTDGPGGTTVFAAFDPVDGGPDAALEIRSDCADLPKGLFATQLGPCVCLMTNRTLVGSAKVCFPNPMHSAALTYVVRCRPAAAVTPPSCSEREGGGGPDEFLVEGKCCQILAGTVTGSDPLCGTTESFETTIASGITVDLDRDDTPDVVDNCPGISNYNQRDLDSDGVGDACDNCPDTPNRDQADADHDGVGDGCESLDAGGG